MIYFACHVETFNCAGLYMPVLRAIDPRGHFLHEPLHHAVPRAPMRVFPSYSSGILLLAFLVATLAHGQTPVTLPQGTFFSTVAEEAYSTYQMTTGNGDLWPSCWADDDTLYSANGDGTGLFKHLRGHARGTNYWRAT